MKKLSGFERAVLGLTAAFLICSAGYFAAADRSPVGAWRVETERSAGVPAASSGREENSRPDSLLEGEVIDLNTAAQADLERLPGIGQARARAIVEYRQEHGPFGTVDELTRVSGIGQGILAGLRDYVTVG